MKVTRFIAPAVIAAAALAASAAPAFADGGPVTATVNVASNMTFAFTSPTSFSVTPGATTTGAVAFTVTTNDTNGYDVSQSAPDLVAGANTLPATDLSFVLNFNNHDGTGQTPSAHLTNASARFIHELTPSMSGGDIYSQDYSATVPTNAAPGAYSTTITIVAAAN